MNTKSFTDLGSFIPLYLFSQCWLVILRLTRQHNETVSSFIQHIRYDMFRPATAAIVG